jgi:hypothetical protein
VEQAPEGAAGKIQFAEETRPQGLKPFSMQTAYAALKGRSSTVTHAVGSFPQPVKRCPDTDLKRVNRASVSIRLRFSLRYTALTRRAFLYRRFAAGISRARGTAISAAGCHLLPSVHHCMWAKRRPGPGRCAFALLADSSHRGQHLHVKLHLRATHGGRDEHVASAIHIRHFL